MVNFKGFSTKEKALEYQKKHGGMLCYKKSDIEKRGKNPQDYDLAVNLGGLNKDKYPYCVQWNAK